jgi:hypothetical protein
VEGEAGTDTMIFNGAGVAENFDFSANGNRLKFFRNVANITMDRLAIPASPRMTSAPLRPRRARSRSSSMRAQSGSRPTSTRQR